MEFVRVFFQISHIVPADRPDLIKMAQKDIEASVGQLVADGCIEPTVKPADLSPEDIAAALDWFLANVMLEEEEEDPVSQLYRKCEACGRCIPQWETPRPHCHKDACPHKEKA